MTKKEIVRRAICHEDVPEIPYAVSFVEAELEKMVHYTGNIDYMESVGNYLESCVYSPGMRPAEHPGYVRDNFGVVWNRTGADKDVGVIENIQITDWESFERYKFPKVDEEELRGQIELFFKKYQKKDVFCFGAIGFSLFERAWTLMGMENLLVAMVEEPELVCALLDKIVQFNQQVMDIMLEYPFDGFHFGDDWGQQRGLLMGPVYWRKFLKPRMRQMYMRVKERGLWVSQHSCGDLREILDDLIEIGLDVYQTFQPEIYDLEYEKRTHGDRLTFWGGISTQTLLPSAAPEEVHRETKHILQVMGGNGRYIAGPTHAVPGDVPPENILAMLKAFREQNGGV